MKVYNSQIQNDAGKGPILKHVVPKERSQKSVVVKDKERSPKAVVVQDKEQIPKDVVVEDKKGIPKDVAVEEGLRRILEDVGVVEKENKGRKKRRTKQDRIVVDPWDGNSVFSGDGDCLMGESRLSRRERMNSDVQSMNLDLWRSVMSYLPVAEIPVVLKVSKEFKKCAEEKKNPG